MQAPTMLAPKAAKAAFGLNPGTAARQTIHRITKPTTPNRCFSRAAVRATPVVATPLSRPVLHVQRAISTQDTCTGKTSTIVLKCPSPLIAILRQPCRAASTASASPSTSTAPSSHPSTSSPSSPAADPALGWNAFFQLRKTRRRWQLAFSTAGFAGCFVGGAIVLESGIAAPLVAQIPLDPFITMGLITMSCAIMGWLLGPILGSAVFGMRYRGVRRQFTTKENDFFARIKKRRVDPSSSSAGNPVPDFYGEKISSVKGYRQWLKDQRAFNKKRTSFV